MKFIKHSLKGVLTLLLVVLVSAVVSMLVTTWLTTNHLAGDQPFVKRQVMIDRDHEWQLFDNISGYPMKVVPNVVHYVLYDIHEIQFAHYISILSVLKNQRPDLIMIHCDCDQLNGRYWRAVNAIARRVKTKIVVRRVEKITEIFGRQLSEQWLNWHSSDIMRNVVLREFGGIYLDRDVYVVKSLDAFRNYEMTLAWDENQSMGSQLQMAHKNARFLRLYYESYRDYDREKWYYNAGVLPTKAILEPMPHLVHRVMEQFGVDGQQVCPKIYTTYYPNWQNEFYAIHFLMRGNRVVFRDWCSGDSSFYIDFDEKNSPQLNVTFGEMTRLLFDVRAYAFH